ncbi:MAG: hypothetical protein A2W00_02440 [Candidatus Eisenbacteria bacterium RBG_16_71_46]|nr:MAG: hypothetical protein A2W00_02440 [Candidatus Eisenbacteria bacterium RBG_16_71_46]
MADRFAIGLDLGGTDLKAALVAEDGLIARFLRLPTRAAESAEAPLEAIAQAVAELRGREAQAVACIGLGAPGAIHPADGALVGSTPHLPHWDSLPLREQVSARLGCPVSLDNDANLAALAEHRAGAARGARVSVTVTVGTGVGGGIVVDGQLLRGAFGGAGEIGHLPLGSGEWPCRCGVERCVEPEMSGSGLVRAARAAGLEVEDAGAVFAAAAAGDTRAARLVARMADRLGAALASAINLINPEVVVIGGGVALAGEALLVPVRAAVERYALASHRRSLEIVPAALGERAGVVGAGLLAWEERRARAGV